MSPKCRRVFIYAVAMLCIIPILAAPLVSAKIQPLGWWDEYTHRKTIPEGEGLLHRHKHEGALWAEAVLISSTGEISFSYQWDEPNLFVIINNLDNKAVTVKWKCRFYVN